MAELQQKEKNLDEDINDREEEELKTPTPDSQNDN